MYTFAGFRHNLLGFLLRCEKFGDTILSYGDLCHSVYRATPRKLLVNLVFSAWTDLKPLRIPGGNR